MRIFFELVKNHFVATFSTIFIFLFFFIFLISFLVSDRVVESFIRSDYFEEKLKDELVKFDLTFKSFDVLEVENLRKAKISIKGLSYTNKNSLKAKKTALEIDLVNLFFQSKYINDLTVEELFFKSTGINLGLGSEDTNSLIKELNSTLESILNKTKTKSFLIKSFFIETANSKITLENFNFRELERSKKLNALLTYMGNGSRKALTSKIELETKDNFSNIFFTSKLIFNDAGFPKMSWYNDDIKAITEWFRKERIDLSSIALQGNFEIKTKKLTLDVISENDALSLNLRINLAQLINENQVLINDLSVSFQNQDILVETAAYDLTTSRFSLVVDQLNIRYFPEKLMALKLEGFYDFKKDSVLSFKVSWDLNQSNNKSGNVKILKLKKENNFSLRFQSSDSLTLKPFIYVNLSEKRNFLDTVEARVSGVMFDTIVESKNGKISFDEIKFQTETFSLLTNSNLFVEMDKFSLIKDKVQGRIQAQKISKIKSLSTKIHDFSLDFGNFNSFQDNVDVSVSLISNYKNFIEVINEQIFNDKLRKTWIVKNLKKNQDNKFSLVYSKRTSLKHFEDFINFENAVYELKLDKYSLSADGDNSYDFKDIELIGFGENITFELKKDDSDKKIKGNVSNWLNALKQDNFRDLNLFVSDFRSQSLFPEIKSVITKGPVKINLSASKENGQNVVFGKVDLSLAEIIFPNFFINKQKNSFGELKFRFFDYKKSQFSYKQKNIFLEGIVQHDKFSKINKITYSAIKISDLIKGKAEYVNFPDHKEFNLKNAIVDLAYLKKLKIRTRKKPIDIIFSKLSLKSNRKTIMEDIRGEIRVFNGVRGYAKSANLKGNETNFTFTPNKKNQTEVFIYSNNAGNFLRSSQFYENGYGGRLKIKFLYMDKGNIKGEFEIDDFRVRKAPILAQLISAASIIGLLDSLNGIGLLFTKIEGKFLYKENKLELVGGVAMGPSIGLTMSGFEKYNVGNNEVKVEGLISPIYIINGVVKSIPIIGKVFGGERGEGVFGMAYKVEGNSKKPRVFVNPLSIITPGAFRNIFNLNGKEK